MREKSLSLGPEPTIRTGLASDPTWGGHLHYTGTGFLPVNALLPTPSWVFEKGTASAAPHFTSRSAWREAVDLPSRRRFNPASTTAITRGTGDQGAVGMPTVWRFMTVLSMYRSTCTVFRGLGTSEAYRIHLFGSVHK
jgi:hypothetical protein